MVLPINRYLIVQEKTNLRSDFSTYKSAEYWIQQSLLQLRVSPIKSISICKLLLMKSHAQRYGSQVLQVLLLNAQLQYKYSKYKRSDLVCKLSGFLF